jgi:O-acetylhomoserine (thiol)-lyase
MAALEGGVGAIATASGMAAFFLTVATLMDQGSHIVASNSIYGGTHNILSYTLPRFGITTTFVDPENPNNFKEAIQDNTRLIFAETIGNPNINVLDVDAISKITRDANLPFMVDSTFTTPYLMQPLKLGADIVMHSLTKFIAGHGIAIGGIVIDSGKFIWSKSDKFPNLTEPYAGYDNIVYEQEFGVNALIMRMRSEGMKDFGACLSPMNAFHILQGLETLPVRMDRHVQNAQQVAEYLYNCEEIEWVNYPSLKNNKSYKIAQKLLPKGAGAILSFGIKGGKIAGKKFIENTTLSSHLANVGDAKTLVIHPASTTHQQMSDDALKKSGIKENLIRISVGIEDISDIINDLKLAIKASQRE